MKGASVAQDRRRVLLKLSGEVFGGGKVGLDPEVISGVAAQIAKAAASGVEVAVVVGGGNFYRGAELSAHGLDRARADYMGMLGTVMNALALQDFLDKAGAETRVQTAITMTQVAEPYTPLRAIRHMEKGRVVVFGAGSGIPSFQQILLLRNALWKLTVMNCWWQKMGWTVFTPRIQKSIPMQNYLTL